MVEHGQFLVGSLTDDGQVTLLPSLGGEQVSWQEDVQGGERCTVSSRRGRKKTC